MFIIIETEPFKVFHLTVKQANKGQTGPFGFRFLGILGADLIWFLMGWGTLKLK